MVSELYFFKRRVIQRDSLGAQSFFADIFMIPMSQFYQELNKDVNKAQALQNAQLKLFKTEKRPYFWAPYVLVGNWL